MSESVINWDYSGQTVLVTGAGRGLGEAIARAFDAAGAKVIAVARNSEELERLAASCQRVEAWQEDITKPAFVERLNTLPTLDVLVNNAGFNRPQPMPEVAADTLDHMLDLNVRAAYLTAQAAIGIMLRQGGGNIVNMSSQMGHVGSPNRTVYCMTKHALEGLTKAMAVELGGQQIRVNAVAPTFVDTPLTRPMLDDPEFHQFVMDRIPLAKLGKLDDVVNAVLYLASPLASTITGHSLLVDGGWTAH